ncbi:MAG: hypothetical protein AAF889_03735 [Cyanobacteria bacterium P01_D01_bin.73]
MVQFSPAAIAELRRWSQSQEAAESTENWTVILSRVSGSCYNQWAYDLQLSPSLPKSGDDKTEEVVVDELLEEGLRLVIPGRDRKWCDELSVDYAEDLVGGAFRFVNPRAIATCSCGVCFDLE